MKQEMTFKKFSIFIVSILMLITHGVAANAATDRIVLNIPRSMNFSQIPYQLPIPLLNGVPTYFTSVNATPTNTCTVEEEYSELAAEETRPVSFSIYATNIGTCSITANVFGSTTLASASVSITKANSVITTSIVDATIPLYQESIPISATVENGYWVTISVQASSASVCQILDDSNSRQSLFFYRVGLCRIDFRYSGDAFNNPSGFTRTLKIVSAVDPRATVGLTISSVFKEFFNGGVSMGLDAIIVDSPANAPTISWRDIRNIAGGSGCGVDSDTWDTGTTTVYINKIGKCRVKLFTQANATYKKSKVKVLKLDQTSYYTNATTFVAPDTPNVNGVFPDSTGQNLLDLGEIVLPLYIKSVPTYPDWNATSTTPSACSIEVDHISKILAKLRVTAFSNTPGTDCKFRIAVPAQNLFLNYSKDFTITLN
jgi:hypothetical protein